MNSFGEILRYFLSEFNCGENMKAELVYGKLIRVENKTLTLEVKTNMDVEEIEYPLAMDLDEQWVIDNLGTYLNVVVIDGEVRGFRSE